jgi:hypothetical protein
MAPVPISKERRLNLLAANLLKLQSEHSLGYSFARQRL